ncbi:MAG: ABC transporter permease [Hyphomicrobiales bacterium]
MLTYLAKRLLMTVPTLLGAAVLIFFMLRVVPGDVVEVKLRGDGATVTQTVIDAERSRLGLDRPLPEQFASWIVGLVKLDPGLSMWTGKPVVDEMKIRLPLSIQVAVMGALIATLLAVPMGTLSALYRDSPVDYLLRIFSLVGLAVPAFWFGMVLILLLLWLFNWLPPVIYTPFFVDPVANLSQLIWPALVVGIRYAAVVARMVRSSVIEVMKEDYIRTARAKGLAEKVIIVRHAMKNAMLPAITVIGLEFAFLMGGLVVTEQVFNLNGIGQLFVQAVAHRDFVLVQNIVMFIAAVFVFTNLAVDLLYAAVDPRIRYR